MGLGSGAGSGSGYLVRVEAVPLLVVELLVEGEDVGGRDEVDEGVAHVAPRVRVRARVKVRVRVRVRVGVRVSTGS